jgi:hypothetical protein
MSGPDAKNYVRQTLQGALGRHFKPDTQLHSRCSRTSATRFVCSTNWTYATNDYDGTVVVWYELVNAEQVWTARYAVRWVSDHCSFHGPHPRRCKTAKTSGRY